MINIFIESKNDKTPEYTFVNTVLSMCLSEEELKNIKVIPVNGKDNLKSAVPSFKQNSLERGKNIVIFDADGAENGGGYETRKGELMQKKEDLGIEFELFLFPNNKDDGEFETLLKQLTVDEHKGVIDCYDKFECCLSSHKDENGNQKYKLPNIKSRYFTYISSMPLSKKQRYSISYKWLFDDTKYWDLGHSSLDSLKDFIVANCR